MREQKGNVAALLPIGVFLVIFLGSGIVTGDFYAMPAIVAFLIALLAAFLQHRELGFQDGQSGPVCSAGPYRGGGPFCDRLLYLRVHGNFHGDDRGSGADRCRDQ